MNPAIPSKASEYSQKFRNAWLSDKRFKGTCHRSHTSLHLFKVILTVLFDPLFYSN
jgi:hypothetical protein